jgi:hypothetical protein
LSDCLAGYVVVAFPGAGAFPGADAVAAAIEAGADVAAGAQVEAPAVRWVKATVRWAKATDSCTEVVKNVEDEPGCTERVPAAPGSFPVRSVDEDDGIFGSC